MKRIGYFLSCEEYPPEQLIEQGRLAEQAGFEALWISDHYHPWVQEQGQSPFVWSMIGAIAQVCDLPVGTAVTCPTTRIHPAIIAQAAATSALLLGPGRFTLGVGSGEALNEHILGDRWPHADERLEMLEEAVSVIRSLWSGEVVSHAGKYYEVDTARIYTMPQEAPPIYLSAFGSKALELACRVADGLISTMPDADSVRRSARPRVPRHPPRPASRWPGAARATRPSTTHIGCGPTPVCRESCRRCCPPRSTSSRRPSS